MVPHSSDDDIKAGSDILLKGGRMLNKACPNCLSPLYNFKNKTYCVKCKQEYVMVDSPAQIPRNAQPAPSQPAPVSNNSLSKTAQIIQQKIDALSSELTQTTDLKRIQEISSAIKTLVETLKML